MELKITDLKKFSLNIMNEDSMIVTSSLKGLAGITGARFLKPQQPIMTGRASTPSRNLRANISSSSTTYVQPEPPSSPVREP